MVRIRSRAIRSVTRIPDRDAFAVEMAVTRGIARPRAWGQAMTRTVTVRSTAKAGSPSRVHTSAVTVPAARAT